LSNDRSERWGGADVPFEALLSGAFWGQFMLLLMLRRAAGRRFDVLFLEWLLRNREDAPGGVTGDVDHPQRDAITT
jgi:hypothetical protein